MAEPTGEYVILEKEVTTGNGKGIIHVIDPPQDVKMSWGITFVHSFPLSRQMSQTEFVKVAKQQIAAMQKEIETKYPQEFFEEMRKKNFLDARTFKNGNGA